MGNIGNCIHTNENLWEFLGILNDSKNFKVKHLVGTSRLFLGKTIKCSNVMKMLKNFNNHLQKKVFLDIYQLLYTKCFAGKIVKKQ